MSSASEPEGYTTLDAEVGGGVEVELEVRRSRFLTVLRRVTDEEAARDLVAERRKEYFDASHHCSAIILGHRGEITRSSDDGEPSGTAGVPMLAVLRAHDLTDVVAVVTQWFGGTKLGTGGLARAYGDAVALAVESAGPRRVERLQRMDIRVDVADAGHIEESLRRLALPEGRFEVMDTQWGAEARIRTVVSPVAAEELDAALASLSAGRLTAEPSGEAWWEVRR